jgi:hypothetical protein
MPVNEGNSGRRNLSERHEPIVPAILFRQRRRTAGETPMTKVITTAQVQDSAKWKTAFQTHADLFREYTATNIYYTTNAQNEVAIVFDVKDVDKYLKLMDSPETAAAMANDGVKRDTVKVFVLGDEIKL